MQQAPIIDLIVAAYTTEEGANHALGDLTEAQRDGTIEIKDAAVLRKDANSRLHVDDTRDKGIGRGALLGGVTGAVVGLLAGPVGWATLGGVAIGSLASKLRESGVSDQRLKQIGESLTPRSSALIAVIEERWVSEVERVIAQTGAEMATEAIASEIAEQLERDAEAMSAAEHHRRTA